MRHKTFNAKPCPTSMARKLIYDGAEDLARVTVKCIYKLGLGVEEKNCQNMKEWTSLISFLYELKNCMSTTNYLE